MILIDAPLATTLDLTLSLRTLPEGRQRKFAKLLSG
jgi:hypothetical protein